MSKNYKHHSVHREWLQQIQPEGLVVAASVLEERGFNLDRNISNEKAILAELVEVEEVSLEHDGQNVTRLNQSQHDRFFREILKWGELGGNRLKVLSGAELRKQRHLMYDIPEYDEVLRPTYAVYELPECREDQEASQEEEEYQDSASAFLSQFITPPKAEEPQVKEDHKVKYSELDPRVLIVHLEGDVKLDAKRSEV